MKTIITTSTLPYDLRVTVPPEMQESFHQLKHLRKQSDKAIAGMRAMQSVLDNLHSALNLIYDHGGPCSAFEFAREVHKEAFNQILHAQEPAMEKLFEVNQVQDVCNAWAVKLLKERLGIETELAYISHTPTGRPVYDTDNLYQELPRVNHDLTVGGLTAALQQFPPNWMLGKDVAIDDNGVRCVPQLDKRKVEESNP